MTDESPAERTLPIILAKVRVPRRRPDLLSRRRLVELLHSLLDRKLILISAAAGYGKTTLLTELAQDIGWPVCWYSLDPFDSDLRSFLEHLIAAINQRFPAFGERTRAFLCQTSYPASNLYPLVATLVQEIYDVIPEYFVLILDDHHTVENQEAISEFLGLFVTYVDENCHLIIASRTLPALPNLSLLVARRQAAGLSIDELRFTPQEIQALALQNYGLQLGLEQANDLAERTGGWITGLLLTAAPRWEQSQGEVTLRGRINIDLYDYLSKQVLERQPPALREFLLASSVLDEMSAGLCAAVLGDEVGPPQEMLEQVRSRSLFVTEYEGDDRLRYHDLFREFLQASLGHQDPVRFRELTRRAADAYAALGELERAISRYLALGDYERAAFLVEDALNRLYMAGHWDMLAAWIDALPETARQARPMLLITRAKIHAERSEQAQALALYAQAGKIFGRQGSPHMVAEILVQRSYILRFQGRYAEAVAGCQEAMALAGGTTPREVKITAMARRNAGICQLRQGQLPEGRRSLEQALALYEQLGGLYDVGLVRHDLGLSDELAGDLDSAMAHYQAALAAWQQIGNPAPWANTLNGLGVVYHLQGRYDDALRTLEEALDRARQAGDLRIVAFAWASLGDVRRDLGAYELATQAYNEGLSAANRSGGGFIITYLLDALGNTARVQGNLTEARASLLQAMATAREHSSDYEAGLCHVSFGILALKEGDLPSAVSHLEQAVMQFEGSGFRRDLARVCLLRAQAAFLAGDRDAALAGVERAAALAGELGFDQFLVVEGQGLRPLLHDAAGREGASAAVRRLLERIDAFEAWLAARPEPGARVAAQPPLKIYALGPPRVEMNDQPVQWPTAQSRDLLYCLLQHPLGLRKEEVGSLFWPDHPPHRLDGIFRSTLYRLRRALHRDAVIFDEGVYCFNRGCDYWYDVEEFEQLIAEAGRVPARAADRRAALLVDALALYRDDYLEGTYADWCMLERERLREQMHSALEALAGLYSERGNLPQAVELYQRLLALDPYQESVHQALMRCYWRLGDRAAAIRQYQAFARVLRTELGLSPAAETEALYLQIIA